jgi:hypothetical protein
MTLAEDRIANFIADVARSPAAYLLDPPGAAATDPEP